MPSLLVRPAHHLVTSSRSPHSLSLPGSEDHRYDYLNAQFPTGIHAQGAERGADVCAKAEEDVSVLCCEQCPQLDAQTVGSPLALRTAAEAMGHMGREGRGSGAQGKVGEKS